MNGIGAVRIGIDLGGTKMAAIALGPEGAGRAEAQCATPRSFSTTIDALADLVDELDRAAGRAATVGIAVPGLIAGDGEGATAVNLPWLDRQPLASTLAARVGRPVRLANDGNCFALSEAVDGAAAGARVVCGLVLGTGVGGGLVVDGRLLPGRHGIAGEWGHLPLPWRTAADGPSRRCGCGRIDCIESFLSGAGLTATWRQQTGTDATPPEIAARALAGETPARAVLGRHQEALARTLAALIGWLDPDAIVIGGGLSDLPGLIEGVPEHWRHLTLASEPTTRLARARHGAASGRRGAAWLWRDVALLFD